MVKRLFDIVFSIFCLIALSPALIIIAILIKLDSDGPILYRQERLGLYACPYTILKFRTMYKDAETDVPQLSAKGDKRVTRLGLVLRKFRLDELPQLWNILKGDMSFVGPRPPLPREVEQYNEYQFGRLAVTPGLTCYWQIQPDRNSLSCDEWFEMDLKYIEERSIKTDLLILCKTVGAVLNMEGV